MNQLVVSITRHIHLLHDHVATTCPAWLLAMCPGGSCNIGQIGGHVSIPFGGCVSSPFGGCVSSPLVAVCPARLETVCPARLEAVSSPFVAVSSPFGGSVSSPIGGCTLTTPFGGAVSSLFSSCCPASCKFGLLAAVCSTCWWMASCRCRPAGVVCPMAATVLLSFAAFLRYNEIAKLRCRDINFAADHNITSK